MHLKYTRELKSGIIIANIAKKKNQGSEEFWDKIYFYSGVKKQVRTKAGISGGVKVYAASNNEKDLVKDELYQRLTSVM